MYIAIITWNSDMVDGSIVEYNSIKPFENDMEMIWKGLKIFDGPFCMKKRQEKK